MKHERIPTSRYTVVPSGDCFQVYDNLLLRIFARGCTWTDAHSLAEAMEASHVRSRQQIADEGEDTRTEYEIGWDRAASAGDSLHQQRREGV